MKLVFRIAIFIYFLHHIAQGLPANDDGQLSDQPRGGNRVGRCFSTMWNWLRGRATKEIEENIISVNPNNVRFFLYNDPMNPTQYSEIVYQDRDSLMKSPYRFGQPWKILIHGYTMSQFGTFPQNVKNAYLGEYKRQLARNTNIGAYNILVVDWSPLADPKIQGSNVQFLLMYAFAVKNVQTTGRRVGEMIQFLKENGGIDSYENVHVIGFSLGAHCAGNAGQTVLKNTGTLLPRITGLDPAGPQFYTDLNKLSSPKLKKEDARFVDVYHTNQGVFGTLRQLGHVDFYPNGGGPVMEYCSQLELAKNKDERSVAELGSCSHNRAPAYFAYSINTDVGPLYACPCSSYEEYKKGCNCSRGVLFGEYCPVGTTGVYYITVPDN